MNWSEFDICFNMYVRLLLLPFSSIHIIYSISGLSFLIFVGLSYHILSHLTSAYLSLKSILFSSNSVIIESKKLYIASDFLSNICHEVNHLYEYDKGREKRVDLYDKVRELIGFQEDEAYIVE